MLYHTLAVDDPNYPALLRQIADPPQRLYVRGQLPFGLPAIAVVGTRKASREGLRVAEEFAGRLARLGIVIVSGLAMGVDTAAHRGALAAGGITVAVLGNGIDAVYPAQNEKLAQRVLESGGAVVSEYQPGEPAYPGNFIRRNRIVSGLSMAVVVVEAPKRSGALATARFAAEQGREVFVVPGPAYNRSYFGSHGLIRDGAILAQSVEEITEDLGLVSPDSEGGLKENITNQLNSEEKLIYQALKDEGAPLEVDRIIELTKLEPSAVSIHLTGLAVKGLVAENGSAYKLEQL